MGPDFHVAWFLLIPALLAILTLPLLLWRRKRLAYLSALCFILWLASFAGIVRNWRGDESVTLAEMTEDLPRWVEYQASLGVYTSRIWLTFEISHGPYDDATPTAVSHQGRLRWQRGPASGEVPPFFWWFRVYSISQSAGPYDRLGGYIALPAWFVSLLLLPLPTWWLLTRNRRLRAARAKANLCTHCGYSLQAHSSGQRCPECGTPIP